MRVHGMLMMLFVTIAGCSDDSTNTNTTPPDTTMTAEGYDKACTTAADCVLVYTGNVCGCGCTKDTIAIGEESRYTADADEKRKSCTSTLECQPCVDAQMAACTQNMCAVVPK